MTEAVDDGVLSESKQSDVERWLLARGVPQLVVDYTIEDRIWTRARPFLIVAFVLQIFLSFGDRFTGWSQAGVFVAGLVIVGSAVTALRRWRGIDPFDTEGGVGWEQLAFFVIVPTVVSALSGTDVVVTMALVAAGNVAFLAVVYVVVGFGLIPLTGWALSALSNHVFALTRLLARTLPVVLVLTVFMFINAEIWQVALLANWTAVALACAALAVIGTIFVAMSADDIVESTQAATLEASGSVDEYLVGTPLEGWPPSTERLELDLGARANLRLVVVFSVGVQVVLVAALIGLTYVGFGLLLIPFDLLELWAGADGTDGAGTAYTVLAEWQAVGLDLTLTVEHLAVSALVAMMAGLSVAASAITDDTYARAFTVRLRQELGQNLVVARTYRTAVERRS